LIEGRKKLVRHLDQIDVAVRVKILQLLKKKTKEDSNYPKNILSSFLFRPRLLQSANEPRPQNLNWFYLKVVGEDDRVSFVENSVGSAKIFVELTLRVDQKTFDEI
jgi:hypothetical protein